jgi:hypothetical protein
LKGNSNDGGSSSHRLWSLDLFRERFCAQIRKASKKGMQRKDINTSHASTQNNAMTFIPDDLYDAGSVDVEMIFDANATPPIDHAAETISIVYPNGASFSCSGFMTNYDDEAPYDDLMTASCTLKFSGHFTLTPGS